MPLYTHYIPHSYAIVQVMLHALPQTHPPFTLTALSVFVYLRSRVKKAFHDSHHKWRWRCVKVIMHLLLAHLWTYQCKIEVIGSGWMTTGKNKPIFWALWSHESVMIAICKPHLRRCAGLISVDFYLTQDFAPDNSIFLEDKIQSLFSYWSPPQVIQWKHSTICSGICKWMITEFVYS